MGLSGSKPPKFEEIHQDNDDKGGDNYLKVKPETKGGYKKSMESLSKMSVKTSSSFTMVLQFVLTLVIIEYSQLPLYRSPRNLDIPSI